MINEHNIKNMPSITVKNKSNPALLIKTLDEIKNTAVKALVIVLLTAIRLPRIRVETKLCNLLTCIIVKIN